VAAVAEEVVEDPQRCGWPVGPHDEVVVDMGTGGAEVWCLAHDEDFLPDLHLGRLGGCAVCRAACPTWTDDDVCLHGRCRRDWMLKSLDRGAKGAYARRKK